MTDRPLRLCEFCPELDDHPRHVIQGPGIGSANALAVTDFPPGTPVEAIQQRLDPDVRVAHMNCCAANGCEVCVATEKANKGLRGEKLTAKVTSAEPLEIPELLNEAFGG